MPKHVTVNDSIVNSGSTGMTVDGQGGVVTAGISSFIIIPYQGTITRWYVIGDQSGSIQFDIKRGGTSIIGTGNHPTLTSQQRNNALVSGWSSITISQFDELEFVVSSATTITACTLVVVIQKT